MKRSTKQQNDKDSLHENTEEKQTTQKYKLKTNNPE